MKVGIIGCGNMGSAIAAGLIDKNILSSAELFLNDKDEEKSKKTGELTGGTVSGLKELIENSDMVLLAVKPQDSKALFDEIRAYVSAQIIVSIMAGVKIADIIRGLGEKVRVVRAMPNMAAFIAESITGISFGENMKNKEEIKKLFESIGNAVEVKEDQMDAVTALSGSGPAYLFYLAKSMIEAGVEAGLEKEKSEKLVIETLSASGKLLKNMETSPEELIKKVASKGGTTEAALNVFEKNKWGEIVKKAVIEAKKRSAELSGGG